jgi:hypothetical protein
MFSTLRTRFGIPGVISVIALVFAMFGGAYAASNSSNAGKATASAKAKKGPRGPKGATGPAGAQGPAGPQGAKGDAGANGSNGTAGPTGPTGAAGAKGATGAAGAPGATGPTGFSGFTETLPSGKTETGKWTAFGYAPPNEIYPFGVISYPIPLAKPSEKVVFLTQAQTESSVGAPVEGCEYELGNPAAKPVAPPGTLCVFTQFKEFGTFNFIGESGGNTGDTRTGTYVWFSGSEIEGPIGFAYAGGTWAVTAK